MAREHVAVDQQKVKLAEKVLLRLARQHGAQGRGLDLPEITPRRQYLAVAAQNLVNRYPFLTVQRFQSRLTLIYRAVQDDVLQDRANHALLRATGFNAQRGDDPLQSFDPLAVETGGSGFDAHARALARGEGQDE